MTKRVNKGIKGNLTAIRLSIPSELWRKFRAGCIYIDKDVNSELNKLIENWVKEWHKRITKLETVQGEQDDIKPHSVEQNPFGDSGSSGESGSSA